MIIVARPWKHATLSACIATIVTGCGAPQLPIGAPRAMPASSSTFHVLHAFHSRDGGRPSAGLVNVDGTLYGTTSQGGANDYGTVFSVTTAGKERVLHSFTGGADGAFPQAALINVNGTLFGTTESGGSGCESSGGCGTIFSITTGGSEKVLYSFAGGSDGSQPLANLTNLKGTLYGTTSYGGGSGCKNGYGCGTVFSVTTAGAESVLYAFRGGSDGANPLAGLIGVNDTLFGTTDLGGSGCIDGCGTVFSVTATGTEKVLHRFGQRHGDGKLPGAGLAKVGATFYGTTYEGGVGCSLNGGCGTVFRITSTGHEKVLYSFGYGSDGAYPAGTLLDLDGTLYGTTTGGAGGGSGGTGTIFSVTTGGAESVLYSFSGGADGAKPQAGLIDISGTLYGTAQQGGKYNEGTVFAFTP